MFVLFLKNHAFLRKELVRAKEIRISLKPYYIRSGQVTWARTTWTIRSTLGALMEFLASKTLRLDNTVNLHLGIFFCFCNSNCMKSKNKRYTNSGLTFAFLLQFRDLRRDLQGIPRPWKHNCLTLAYLLVGGILKSKPEPSEKSRKHTYHAQSLPSRKTQTNQRQQNLLRNIQSD